MKRKTITFFVSREERTNGFYYTITCIECPLLSILDVYEKSLYEILEHLSLDFTVNLGIRTLFQFVD